MTDMKSLFIEKEGRVLNIVMQFRVENYRNGIVLVGTDSFRDPKTNAGYRTMKGTIGFVQVYTNHCAWRYLDDPHGYRHKYDFNSFDEVKKFAVNKFIQIVRAYLKNEFPQVPKLTREDAKQIRAYLRKGIEEMMKE